MPLKPGSAATGATPKAKARSKAKAKAKGRPKAKAQAGGLFAKKAQIFKCAKDWSAGKNASCSSLVAVGPSAEMLGDPDVPRGLMRSQMIKIGPAKGWRVMAWLQDTPGPSSKGHESAIKWRVFSPDRTQVYDSFRSSAKLNLQDNVSEGVYTQIYTGVRPQLLKRITDRRLEIEGRYMQRYRKRRAQSTGIAPVPTRKDIISKFPAVATPARGGAFRKRKTSLAAGQGPDFETPSPLPAPGAGGAAGFSSMLATQPFAPEGLSTTKAAADWSCGCDAHFRRHPKCINSGNIQPPVVHLRDYMLIGRGDTCDLVLDSRRTPQMISRCHVVLHREDGVFTLVDQGSLNGVSVNGNPIRGKQALASKDVITFGVPTPQPEFDYIFESRPDDEPQMTQLGA